MSVALFNTKITIQHSTVYTDDIGNRKQGWEDFHSCFATISGEEGSAKSEFSADGVDVVNSSRVNFTVRYCKKLENITTTEYRVILGDETYNITGIDHMNFKKKLIKLKCERKDDPDNVKIKFR